MKTINVLNEKGKRTELEAASIEIGLSGGRRLRIAFPPGDMGDIAIEAHADAGEPVMLVQPGAVNVVTLHVLSVEQPTRKTSGLDLELEVQKALPKAEKASVPSKTQVRRWVKAALQQDAEITVRFVGEEEGRSLNQEFRQKDAATNVLSFPYASEPLVVGDLVLCWPVVQREALEQGKGLETHAAHLIIHGALHLQGWDHERSEEEAEKMEALEREILARLGYPDPYEVAQ